MTDTFVPFEASLSFQRPSTGAGVLVLERANPSGLASNAAQVVIPVLFSDSARRRSALRDVVISVDGDTAEVLQP